MGFIYVDTGALYRAVGLYVLRKGFDTKDPEKVSQSLAEISIELVFENKEQAVILNGEDVSQAIRSPEASMAASDVSAIKEVRDFLFDLQRNLALQNDCIMDGRDIGTVVLPDAQIKLFLTASAEERARRRYKELVEKGTEVSYESVLADMKQRDFNDSNRAIAPLKAADDAILISTDGKSLNESVEKVIEVIKGELA
ncbi:MAG: (d)CMP kinase [Clostridiales bacterium]|nr:(d)CMP kinase [Clostridiales bacterium]